MTRNQALNELAKATLVCRNLEALLDFTKTRIALRKEITQEELDALNLAKAEVNVQARNAIEAIHHMEPPE